MKIQQPMKDLDVLVMPVQRTWSRWNTRLASVLLTLFAAGSVFAQAPCDRLTTLDSFNGTNGASPRAPLVQGTDGNFYGTTSQGGAVQNGTVFQVTSNGLLMVLVPFPCPGCGGQEGAGLTPGSNDTFLGTSVMGGNFGFGTIFQVSVGGVFNTVVSFNPANGSPVSGLVRGSNGVFYGASGFANPSGAIYQITPGGAVSNVVMFNATNGATPTGLILGRDGNLYGTTEFGGPDNAGTVFQLTRSGTLTTLASFSGTNGANPLGGVSQGNDGNFYGATASGGSNNLGTVFQVTSNGTLRTLVFFTGPNGSSPVGTLLQGSDGNLYGTTASGGSNDLGTIFQITPSGSFRTLVSFNGGNGANPRAGLIQATDGNFYGTTLHGGAFNLGTVFRLNAGCFLCSAPPLVICSTNLTLPFSNSLGSVVSFVTTGTSVCSSVTTVCTPSSGSLFPIGSNIVICTSTDLSSNTASCTFEVTVLGARGVKESVLTELMALKAGLTAHRDADDVEDAIRELTESLAARRWIDEIHLQPKGGASVFEEEQETIQILGELLKSKKSRISGAVLHGLIERLVRADRLLAHIAIEDARIARANAHRIAGANRQLAEGDKDATHGRFEEAIDDYRNAWEQVTPQSR